MGKTLIILSMLLLVSACIKKTEIDVVAVESEALPPIGSNLTVRSRDALRPIPKPMPPSVLQTNSVVALPAGTKPDLTISTELPKKINGVPQITYTKVLIVDGKPATPSRTVVDDEVVVIKTSKPTAINSDDKGFKTFRGIKDGLAEDTEPLRAKIAKIIFPEPHKEEEPEGVKQPEVFCYKSLSDSTCYKKPIPGQEFRRVGQVGY